MIKSIVIDASVVAKWLFSDEQDPNSDLLKEDFANKNISISVPILIFYEINNLLRSAILSDRINQKQAEDLYEGFLGLDFVVYSSKDLLRNTLKRAVEVNISSYDAAYIALAQYLKVPFFTADEKLVKKVKEKGVKFLKDYQGILRLADARSGLRP